MKTTLIVLVAALATAFAYPANPGDFDYPGDIDYPVDPDVPEEGVVLENLR